MNAKELRARPNLERFRKLAQFFLEAYKTGDAAAMRQLQAHFHADEPIPWEAFRADVQKRLRKSNRGPRFALGDAEFLVAQSNGFESWLKLRKHIEAVARKNSPVALFEEAADAVIAGDIAKLRHMLREHPKLVRARSTRTHRSTLLHYVSANGVEDFRQKTPKNIVDVAKILIDAGAEVDAENNPGRGTTVGLIATSYHPAAAGVQIALLELLLDSGASPDGLPSGWNPLTAALANGRGDAAAYLAKRGAKLDLEGSAGVGRLDVVQSFLTKGGRLRGGATKEQLKSGFAWACEFGHTRVVEFLLDRGMTVDDRLRHHNQNALHWAAYGGHLELVKLLLSRGARVDSKDETHTGTPLEWAVYALRERPPEFKDGKYDAVIKVLSAASS
ncbi:MAG TPA: ankyrin repeat domain-containing protein [Bryobacteraceae bacterium]|jgi:ankyrin repeat protein|nr:ankyrin repeat domain-containing protein [Bryobacteraceae bacterium]